MLRNTAHWETKGSDSWEWLVDPWGGQSPAQCLWKLREASTRSKGDSPQQKTRHPVRSHSTASCSVIKQPFPEAPSALRNDHCGGSDGPHPHASSSTPREAEVVPVTDP